MQLVSLILIHWIVIYPMDSASQLLNNWGQDSLLGGQSREKNLRSNLGIELGISLPIRQGDIPRHLIRKCYTLFFIRIFSLKFAKILRTCKGRHTRGSEKICNLFFIAFTFLNPEKLKHIMPFKESECVSSKNFVLSTHSYCVWSIIHLHCTCTIN